jgi:asparagine synthase (glutamine-hydrolysing)
MTETLRDGGSRIYQYLQVKAVCELFDQHAAGRQDHHKILFSLVVFEEWLRAQDTAVEALN